MVVFWQPTSDLTIRGFWTPPLQDLRSRDDANVQHSLVLLSLDDITALLAFSNLSILEDNLGEQYS